LGGKRTRRTAQFAGQHPLDKMRGRKEAIWADQQDPKKFAGNDGPAKDKRATKTKGQKRKR